MDEETIRPSEEELLVFVSSRQDEELCRPRALTIKEVENYPGMRVWAFEDTPASSEQPRDRYIINAGRADLVIWLIGSTTTTPVVEEINACMRAQGKLLAFKLPSAKRDDETESLIKRVSDYATWKTVENVENLPAHIKSALTDEMLRRYRDPAPINHDLFLRQKHRESIAETKRLWTTLGVPEDIAGDLADDHSVGHKLTSPTTGTLIVNAQQGSGKTLAAQRLYQLALVNRLQDHSQPLPVFLNARNISGELKDQVEGYTREHGPVYTQRVLVIIDGLDEAGLHKANQLVNQAQSYTDANQNVAAVVMTRPLPGLDPKSESYALPECDEEEFLFIASKIAGRQVNQVGIPFREYRSRLPLFATIVGAYLRQPMPIQGRTPSQIINEMVRRVLDDSLHTLGDTEEFLKKLAVASITSGESVEKALVASKVTEQARIANSRIVVEESGKFDFTLAIFREWFAARALVEGSVSLEDIELNSDRWVVPLAIAVNSENPSIGREVMEDLSTRDPGIAGLVLEEVKHNWSTQGPSHDLPPGTSLEIGELIRQAMINWQEGLGPLMPVIGPTTQDGNIPTLAAGKTSGYITTAWYRGDEELPPVVDAPEEAYPSSRLIDLNWYGRISRGIENTRVWPWTITKEDLSRSLSDQLRSMRLALESPDGFHEFAYEFAESISRSSSPTQKDLKISESIQFIERWMAEPGWGSRSTITIDNQRYTAGELGTIHTELQELSNRNGDLITEPWPGEDKPWPEGRTGVCWFELYTEERLLERTNAIFGAALRIYNDIVDRWFPAFNKRDQMRSMMPLRLEGELRLIYSSPRREWHDATLTWWPRLVCSRSESGAFFELGPRNRTSWEGTEQKIQRAEEEFIKHRAGFHHSLQILPDNDSRPATKLAHDWLTEDLKSLHWE